MKYKFLKSLFKQEDIFEHYFAIKVNKNIKRFFTSFRKNK